MISRACTVTFLAARLIDSPRRASWYARFPPTLSAEKRGGTCSISPTNARRACWSDPPWRTDSGTSLILVTSPVPVQGVCLDSEPDRGQIALRAGHQKARQFGALSQHDNQESACKRVQRAGVTDLMWDCRAPISVFGSHHRRFPPQPCRPAGCRQMRAWSRARAASVINFAFTASNGPFDSNPAAMGCPPPPKRPARRATSTRQLDLRLAL